MPAVGMLSPSSAAFQSGTQTVTTSAHATPNSFLTATPRVSPGPPVFTQPCDSPFATGHPVSSSSTTPLIHHHYTNHHQHHQHHQHHPSASDSWSRLSRSVEELRSALKQHTVDATSQDPASGPSGDHSRSCMSAAPETLGGGSRPSNKNSDAFAQQPQPQTQPLPQDQSQSANPAAATSAPATAPPCTTDASASSPADAKNKRQLPDAINPNPTQPASTYTYDQELEQTRLKRLRPPVPAVKLLPREYENVHPNDLVILISSMIMELIQYNDAIPLQGGGLTRFHSRTPPRISVRDYLQRLTVHATLSPPILLSMVYYIDRLCALYPAFTVSSLTVHRFLITSATVASKGLSDSFWTNKTYARVGGITLNELALLELEFLWRVEWKIVPQPEVLVDYYLSLVERCEGYALEPEPEHHLQPQPGVLAPPSTSTIPTEAAPSLPSQTT